LGAADRGGYICGAAGLRVQLYPELDVLHRNILRVDRAVLPARRPGHHSNEVVMRLLQVKLVSQHFGSLVAVNNVSMAVESGELRALIGPNRSEERRVGKEG